MNSLIQTSNQISAYYIQPDISTLVLQWIESLDVMPNSKSSYVKSIRYFTDYMADSGIQYPNKQDILNYKKYLDSLDLKVTSFNHYIRIVKLFYRWIYDNDKGMDLAKGLKLKKEADDTGHRPLTQVQVKRLLNSVDTSSLKGFRDYTMMLLMISSGLRTIEISRLTWADLTSSGTIKVHGKGKDTKIEMPLPFEMYNQLLDYKMKLDIQSDTEPMFQTTSNFHITGNGLTSRSISQIVLNYLKSSGVRGSGDTDITAHSLRSTCACIALENGCNLYDIQQQLRHANIKTTEIYLKKMQRLKNNVSSSVFDAIKE